jgi:hypothetical protein
MTSFRMWLVIAESGRLDRDGFNAEFRRQLAALLPRVHDTGRRASLEAVREFDFLGYILTALRNTGLLDRQEREEAAHDVAVYLLVQPGQLFAGYNPTSSGPMSARFALAVRNAVRNVLRTRARRAARVQSASGGGDVLAAIPDRRADPDEDVVAAFRDFVRRRAGDLGVQLLDRRLDGMSLRRIARQSEFLALGDWGVRQLIYRVRDAAHDFVRSHGDEGLALALQRVTGEVREWLLVV